METAARREQLEQLTNPPKKQKVERLFVDEVDDLIFENSVTMSTHDNSVRNAKDYYNSCNVYECDNLTKYKIAINQTDNYLYAFNPHYGWQRVHYTMLIQYPNIKLKLARDNPGKEIILNSAGNRDYVKNDVSNLDHSINRFFKLYFRLTSVDHFFKYFSIAFYGCCSNACNHLLNIAIP